MGKYAQPILVIAGTIIGAEFGNPMLGAFLGGLAGQLLFPTKLPTQVGPRLSDTSTTVSNVGAPIPRGWGTWPASGCIIVQTDIVESIDSQTVGGKGGPSQTTETPVYHQTFAIGINDGLIGGVRVIWANGKPIYDRRPQGATESDTLYAARQAASDQVESGFTLYLGTESQVPDPTLEAFYGVGNISAFRGLAYIVFHNWLNKAQDGNRMPSQWKFEVFGTGTRTDTSPTEYENGQVYPWAVGSYPVNTNDPQLYHFTPTTFTNAYGFDGPYFDFPSAIAALDAYLNTPDFPLSIPTPNSDYQPDAPSFTWIQGCSYRAKGYNTALSTFLNTGGGDDMTAHQDLHYAYVAVNGWQTSNTHISAAGATWTSGPWEAVAGAGEICSYDDGNSSGVGYWKVGATTDPLPTGWQAQTNAATGHIVVISPNRFIRIQRREMPPDDPCLNRPDVPGASDYCVSAAGVITARGPWTFDSSPGAYRIMKAWLFQQGIPDVSETGIGPIVLQGGPDDNSTFWTAAYNLAVLRQQMPPGLVYNTDYPVLTSEAWLRPKVPYGVVTTGDASVGSIVGDLCAEAGLQTIDVSGISALRVYGYIRTNVMAARAAIDPLRQSRFFDGVESEGAIVFRPRGADVVATISADDLGAAAEGAQAPSVMDTKDAQDVDLPRQVRVHYISPARDYESGEQDSPPRADTLAVQASDIELPICLTDTDAMQIAQGLWAQSWWERTTYSATLEGGLQALEPADPVAIPVDGITVRARIVSIADTIPATRLLQLVADDAAAYVSQAISNPSVPIPVPAPSIVIPADAIFLDIPLLRDADNDGGFYVAMYGLIPDLFAGGAVYRSTDGGGSYTKIGSVARPSVQVGTVLTALPAGPTDVFDEGNTLTVELLASMAVFSDTEANVLAGANAAAIGADGRWEIVQFKTVALVAGSVYSLSGLLRGRRGTEWAVGMSQAGDRFVLLGPCVRMPLDTTLLNNSYLYKVVSNGSSIDGTAGLPFTGHGVALKPFSPVEVAGTIDGGNNWNVTWIRRGRIGQTLQGADVPLNEATEAYQIDIMDGSTVKRTLSSSTQAVQYTSANQVTDFGGNQTTITINIYQMSAVVGRGYAAHAVLT